MGSRLRQTGRRRPDKPGNQPTGSQKFGRGEIMPTAYAQADEERKRANLVIAEEYLGKPTDMGDNPFKATLVLPGKHRILPKLGESSFFDDIRRAHEVWILQDELNILHISSRTLCNLQEGFKAINRAVNDLRGGRQNVSTQYLVQVAMDANVDVMITVDLDSRPRVESQPHMEQLVPIQAETCSSAHGILEQLRPIFLSSTDALRALKETLWMRVDFGHVIIHRRKKIQGNKMSYTDFAEMASQYGTRGGAELDVKLEDDGLASSTIRHLLDPTTEFGGGLQELRYQENISVKIQERNLMADFKSHPNRPATLANVRLVEPNRWPPLRWAIIAPDRKYDWAIRVDCGRIVQPIPTEMLSLIASITIKSEAHGGLPEDFLRKTPTVHLGSGTTWIDKIESIQVKASVSIPFRDTPYVIEISTHREWQGASTRGEPQSWLSLGVYGVHWDAELNSTKANDTKKDWGYEQSDIWRGSADTATGQFEEFVCYVLEVLSALEDVKVRC